MNYDKPTKQICDRAGASGSISRSDINYIRRVVNILSSPVQALVWAVDHAILMGKIIIHEDGDGEFNSRGTRVKD